MTKTNMAESRVNPRIIVQSDFDEAFRYFGLSFIMYRTHVIILFFIAEIFMIFQSKRDSMGNFQAERYDNSIFHLADSFSVSFLSNFTSSVSTFLYFRILQ